MIIRNPLRRLRIAVLAALFQPLVAQGQSVLLPGSHDLTTAQLPGASGTIHIFGSNAGDTAQTTIATVHYERHLVAHVAERHNEPGVILIFEGGAAGQTFSDSALFMLHSLAPVWEIAQSPDVNEHFTYDGAHVTATRVKRDSGERHFDTTYAVPVFTFQLRNELIESVPLHSGYRAILPIYSEGDHALEMDTVLVTAGKAAHEWQVRYGDPVIVGTFTIDGRTREITGYSHTFRKNGYTMRWVIEPQKRKADRSY